MHVLLMPKWYPGRNDPQLGDFIRKQALAASMTVRMSVLHVEGVRGLAEAHEQELREADGPWELAVRYRACTHRLGLWRRAVNLVRFWRSCASGWQRVLRERGRPDLVQAYILVRPALFAYHLRKRHGIPYLLSEQSSEYLDGTYARKGPLFHALNRFLFRRAAAVSAVSPHLAQALVRHRLAQRPLVVPNVIPGLDRPLPPPGEPGRLLMVADLVDRTKNVSGVLYALDRAHRHDDRLRLHIIGDGPDRHMLEETVQRLGLSARVTFLGRLPNSAVLDHMGRAFAVVVNSNVETFSVVTGEALAQGKPVIATRCGGPEAFITELNGILIPPRDTEALADAMLRLLQQAERYSPVTIRRTVSSRFSPEAVGRAMQQAYTIASNHHS